MDLRTATEQKINAMLRVVEALRARDYPQQDARPVADKAASILKDRRDELAALPANTSLPVVQTFCSAISQLLDDLLLLLGFLQRSQHSANPFEVYDPLRRVVTALFSGSKVQLVLSSEWQLSPYTVPMSAMATLPDVVLIGLPASESGNVLLIPLAGHEMGHSLWVSEQGNQQYDVAVGSGLFKAIQAQWLDFQKHFQFTGSINDLFTTSAGLERVQPLARYALQQAEEVFCDLLGLRLFGESYLQALSYLLAPNWPGDRPFHYPSERQRAEYLVNTATKYGLSHPAGFVDRFVDTPPPRNARRALGLTLVDTTTAGLVDSLWTHVDSLVSAANITLPTEDEVDRIVSEFKRVVPASNPVSLAAITLAGWRVMLLSNRWTEYPQIADHRWHLNELMLKSAQVLEIKTRLAEQP